MTARFMHRMSRRQPGVVPRKRIPLWHWPPEGSEVVKDEAGGSDGGAARVGDEVDDGLGRQRTGQGGEGAGAQLSCGGDAGKDGPSEAGGGAALDGLDTAEAGAPGVRLPGREQLAGDVVAVAAAVLEQQDVLLRQLRPVQLLPRMPGLVEISGVGGGEQGQFLGAELFEVQVGRGESGPEEQRASAAPARTAASAGAVPAGTTASRTSGAVARTRASRSGRR